jgi:hypothetical protein
MTRIRRSFLERHHELFLSAYGVGRLGFAYLELHGSWPLVLETLMIQRYLRWSTGIQRFAPFEEGYQLAFCTTGLFLVAISR